MRNANSQEKITVKSFEEAAATYIKHYIKPSVALLPQNIRIIIIINHVNKVRDLESVPESTTDITLPAKREKKTFFDSGICSENDVYGIN